MIDKKIIIVDKKIIVVRNVLFCEQAFILSCLSNELQLHPALRKKEKTFNTKR